MLEYLTFIERYWIFCKKQIKNISCYWKWTKIFGWSLSLFKYIWNWLVTNYNYKNNFNIIIIYNKWIISTRGYLLLTWHSLTTQDWAFYHKCRVDLMFATIKLFMNLCAITLDNEKKLYIQANHNIRHIRNHFFHLLVVEILFL